MPEILCNIQTEMPRYASTRTHAKKRQNTTHTKKQRAKQIQTVKVRGTTCKKINK